MKVVLVIGSNVGNPVGSAERDSRLLNILAALEFLSGKADILATSKIYETPDSLGTGQKYLNAVVFLNTEMEEEGFNSLLKAFEIKCGRTLECRARGEVPLDMDIVMCNDEIRRPEDYRAAYFRKGFKQIEQELNHTLPLS